MKMRHKNNMNLQVSKEHKEIQDFTLKFESTKELYISVERCTKNRISLDPFSHSTNHKGEVEFSTSKYLSRRGNKLLGVSPHKLRAFGHA